MIFPIIIKGFGGGFNREGIKKVFKFHGKAPQI